MSRPGRRGFPAYFDQTAWEEDLARSTPAGHQAAEVTRQDYERGGVPVEHLRRVQEHGDDGTVLPDCAKVYLPPPAGRFGMIFRAIRVEDGRFLPISLSGCATTHEAPGARPSINSPIRDCTASHQGAKHVYRPHLHPLAVET